MLFIWGLCYSVWSYAIHFGPCLFILGSMLFFWGLCFSWGQSYSFWAYALQLGPMLFTWGLCSSVWAHDFSRGLCFSAGSYALQSGPMLFSWGLCLKPRILQLQKRDFSRRSSIHEICKKSGIRQLQNIRVSQSMFRHQKLWNFHLYHINSEITGAVKLFAGPPACRKAGSWVRLLARHLPYS